MESCPHINSFSGPIDAAIFDPSRWQCSECGTTEWVWACLTCANIACGRTNEQHAEQHFCRTRHPLAVEINEKYVYCYVCDDYVLADNKRGDIAAIRSALTDVGTLSPEEVKDKGGSLLQTFSSQQEFSRNHADENDRLITAICHHRKSLLGKALSAWQAFLLSEQEQKARKSTTAFPSMVTRSRNNLYHVKKRTLIPGVTGLRNLGNTCYMNSIIQALGHLEDFREFFCQVIFGLFSPTGTPLHGNSPNSLSTSPNNAKNLLRLNTIDYFQHLSNNLKNTTSTSPKKMKKNGGLNGGGIDENGTVTKAASSPSQVHCDGENNIVETKAHVLKALSLCQEMHGLLRVLWSGKWAQVSPHGFLHALWRTIPAFKGHLQHDAQEFLCELLDKMSQEIENLPQCKGLKNMIDQSFRGEFVSQVTCMGCRNVSCRYEPFLDVSLEFPRRFQSIGSQNCRKMCHLTEMLSSFTDVEELEPLSYSCENCNKQRRRASRQKETKTNATKQLLISQFPEILRLHLKRFRWCGRNNREKIGTHVAFDEELDLSPFCLPGRPVHSYRLSAVVVHHGAGFRAGHYTTFVYNNSAASWLHCNDSRVQLVTTEEVLASQAYILFYTHHLTGVNLENLQPQSTTDTDALSNISTAPELDPETLQTLCRGETEHLVDDEISISFHRDPALVKRLSSTPTLKFEISDNNASTPSNSIKQESLSPTQSYSLDVKSDLSDSSSCHFLTLKTKAPLKRSTSGNAKRNNSRTPNKNHVIASDNQNSPTQSKGNCLSESSPSSLRSCATTRTPRTLSMTLRNSADRIKPKKDYSELVSLAIPSTPRRVSSINTKASSKKYPPSSLRRSKTCPTLTNTKHSSSPKDKLSPKFKKVPEECLKRLIKKSRLSLKRQISTTKHSIITREESANVPSTNSSPLKSVINSRNGLCSPPLSTKQTLSTPLTPPTAASDPSLTHNLSFPSLLASETAASTPLSSQKVTMAYNPATPKESVHPGLSPSFCVPSPTLPAAIANDTGDSMKTSSSSSNKNLDKNIFKTFESESRDLFGDSHLAVPVSASTAAVAPLLLSPTSSSIASFEHSIYPVNLYTNQSVQHSPAPASQSSPGSSVSGLTNIDNDTLTPLSTSPSSDYYRKSNSTQTLLSLNTSGSRSASARARGFNKSKADWSISGQMSPTKTPTKLTSPYYSPQPMNRKRQISETHPSVEEGSPPIRKVARLKSRSF